MAIERLGYANPVGTAEFLFDRNKVVQNKRNGYKVQPDPMPDYQRKAIEEAIRDHGCIIPNKDKVYLGPNGELTTIKPGLIPDPALIEKNKHKVAKRIASIIALLATGAAAFLFRGKIVSGATKAIKAVSPYIAKTKEAIGKITGTIVEHGKKAVQSLYNTFKNGLKA